MEAIAGLIDTVNCICSTPTCNYIDQHRNFYDDVNELRRKLDILACRKQDMESRLQEEAYRGEMVKQELQVWFEHVEVTNDDVQAVLEKAQRVKWYKRASLGKLVCRKIELVSEMLERGLFPEGLVIERTPAYESTIPVENLVGEISTKENIWAYLMGDEVGMIGVCGMGGVGKTMIMKHVYNDLNRETRFQKVVWVTVSYPVNLFQLQHKIAHAMGERLPEDLDMNRRAKILYSIISKVRYVLILDDVWERFSLQDIGIPKPTLQNGCKVVVTSRSAQVCNFFGCMIIEVLSLSPRESLNLFLGKVGGDVLQVPNLEGIFKLIVEACAGLPLAIVVIARSMRGVQDVNLWRNALNELQGRIKTVESEDNSEIFDRLRFSYDRLGSVELQKCFLHCTLFQEDYKFSNKELIEGWIDEGLMESKSRQVIYDRGNFILHELVSNFLLEKSVDSMGDTNAFKMHGIVRSMAIKWIVPSFGYMVRAGLKLIVVPNEPEWAKDLEKVSLMGNKIFKIPFGFSPKCPTLSTLILSHNPLCEIPETFLEEMPGLKVLDLSSTLLETLPNSISKLNNLTALRLQSCERLKCLPSLGNLMELKKLDLNCAGIEEVPQGIGMLIKLEYLDLFCPLLKEIPMGIVSNLPNLQYFNYS